MHDEYTYESNEDSKFDILDVNGDNILSDIEEEDVVIAIVEELNNPTGGCYYREQDEEDGPFKVGIFDHDDRLLIDVSTVQLAEGFLSHLNRNE